MLMSSLPLEQNSHQGLLVVLTCVRALLIAFEVQRWRLWTL